MAALPYMRLYVADYLADAGHLSTVQHGAYLLLLMAYWQRGEPLPDNDQRLARITRLNEREWLAMRDDLAEFFKVGEGLWVHNRVELELEAVWAKSEQASSAGRASGERRLNGRSTDAQRQSNHTDTDTDTDTDSLSNDKQGAKAKRKRSAKYDVPAPEGVSEEVWLGFIELRKSKGAPLTDYAMKLIGKALEASTGTPDETIGKSILSGWTGVFPMKGQGNGNGFSRPSGPVEARRRARGE